MLIIPHLETDVTTACQLSCVACNHHVPLWRARKGGPWHADTRQVEQDLGHLATLLRADRWGALGGEPLLAANLVDILQVARASGVANAIEVWTNGLLLPRQRPEFWKAFDVLMLSVYEGKHTPESLDWIRARCLDAGVELVVKDERLAPNFRTLLEPEATDPASTKAKFRGCFFRHFSRVANAGFFFTCCCAPHMPMLIQGRPFGTDGVRIDGLTEPELKAYLTRTEPLGACTLCAGRDTAVQIPWREEKDPQLWLRASAGQEGPS